MTQVERVEIRVRGKDVEVPGAVVEGRTVAVTGGLLKIAAVKDEDLVEGELVANPPAFIAKLRASGLSPDIFTFSQRIDEATPRYAYPVEWDNAAAISTTSVSDWWGRIKTDARQNARKAAKRGVVVKVAAFDDEFVAGIKRIYDATPARQGMTFWHYGKSLDRVRLENGTYLDRSEFIGAYFEGELIGFIKFVYVDRIARILQIISMSEHHDKKPTNALIAKAVEVCCEKGMAYLQYTKFSFGNKTQSQLAEFKRRNGFEQMNFPRYFVPLTIKGRVLLRLGLHRGLLGMLPLGLITALLRVRSWLIGLKVKTMSRRPALVGDRSGDQ